MILLKFSKYLNFILIFLYENFQPKIDLNSSDMSLTTFYGINTDYTKIYCDLQIQKSGHSIIIDLHLY